MNITCNVDQFRLIWHQRKRGKQLRVGPSTQRKKVSEGFGICKEVGFAKPFFSKKKVWVFPEGCITEKISCGSKSHNTKRKLELTPQKKEKIGITF